MKKWLYRGIIMVLAAGCTAHPVQAAESKLQGENGKDEGKLQIDLNPQWNKDQAQQTLTVLEQAGITLFVPSVDDLVAANQLKETDKEAAKQAQLFQSESSLLNESVQNARQILFAEPVRVTGVADYQVKKVSYPEKEVSDSIFLSFLLFIAGAIVVLSGIWTWRNIRRKEGENLGPNTP